MPEFLTFETRPTSIGLPILLFEQDHSPLKSLSKPPPHTIGKSTIGVYRLGTGFEIELSIAPCAPAALLDGL